MFVIYPIQGHIWITVPGFFDDAPGGCQPQCDLGIGDHELRHVVAGQRSFDDGSHRAGGHGIGDVIMAVSVLPATCHEEVAGAYLSRVVANRADDGVGISAVVRERL